MHLYGEGGCMRFTADQLAAARTLPKLFTLNVLASVTDTSPSLWHRLKDSHDGPEYETTVGGVTIYRRGQLLHWMHKHLIDPSQTKREDAR